MGCAAPYSWLFGKGCRLGRLNRHKRALGSRYAVDGYYNRQVPVGRIDGYLDHQLVKTRTAGGDADVEDVTRAQRNSANGNRADVSCDACLT